MSTGLFAVCGWLMKSEQWWFLPAVQSHKLGLSSGVSKFNTRAISNFRSSHATDCTEQVQHWSTPAAVLHLPQAVLQQTDTGATHGSALHQSAWLPMRDLPQDLCFCHWTLSASQATRVCCPLCVHVLWGTLHVQASVVKTSTAFTWLSSFTWPARWYQDWWRCIVGESSGVISLVWTALFLKWNLSWTCLYGFDTNVTVPVLQNGVTNLCNCHHWNNSIDCVCAVKLWSGGWHINKLTQI